MAFPRPLPAAVCVAAGIALAGTPVVRAIVDVTISDAALGPVGVAALAWAVVAAIAFVLRRWHAGLIVAGIAIATRVPPSLPGDVVGRVGAPVVATSRGVGAPVDCGDATVWVWTSQPLAVGERIRAHGVPHEPRGLLDPAMPDRAAMMASRGADFEMTATAIERLDDEPGVIARAWRVAAVVQARWAAAIDRAGGDSVGAAALRGIVVGDRGTVPPELDQRWRGVGIYHVLSVSGLHLAVVAGLVFALLRKLVAASPLGGRCRPAMWAAPPAIALAIAYTFVTGAQLATLRSLAVVIAMLVGAMLDRPARLVDALGVAALAVLVWRPADLYDPSFQLSFVAALTLALRPAAAHPGVRGWFVHGATTSLWVALTTAPITAYHFHQVAAGGVIGNLVLTPIVELVALPLGLAGLIVGELVPSLGDLLVRLAADLVALVDLGADGLARVTPVGTIAVVMPLVMTMLVVASLWLAARARRSRADVVGCVVLCLIWLVARTPSLRHTLRVTFLDVGQGDAALVELPDGATWLVDAGGNAIADDPVAAAASGRAIARVLEAYGRDHVDLAILSHPHPDHYLGFTALVDSVPIDELATARETPGEDRHEPGVRTPRLPGFAMIAKTLVDHGTRIVHPELGVVRDEAGVELRVWGPRFAERDGDPLVEATDPVRTVNDNSLVVAIRYRGRTILFAGDIEAEGEHALVAAGIGHVDVVKVPHHGSPTSSSAAFVTATRPSLAVISCGVRNHFHFPSREVVQRWRAAGAEVARTDEDGAITVIVDDAGNLDISRYR